MNQRWRFALMLGLAVLPAPRAGGQAGPTRGDSTRITGVVRDSVSNAPVASATVAVTRDTVVVATATTDSLGRYGLWVATTGMYTLTARRIGWRPDRRLITLPSTGPTITVEFRLVPSIVELEGITITATEPVAIDPRTGDQSYTQQDAHTAPTTTTSQVLQQAIAGAARAPTGEVHIRGQHGEYTYYIDGVPVPAGISGTLNELFDPTVIDRIDFQTGGWDAQYGDKNIAIVKVATRVPAGGFHVEASTYAGSFATDGQTLTASTNAGAIGILLSASRQMTAMRREPVMQDASGAPVNFHNQGEDDFGFGKVVYMPSNRDRLTLDMNASVSRFEVPFDSTGGNVLDDHQQDGNGFLNLGWRHRFDTQGAGLQELFAALYFRRSGLAYTPGAVDRPQFIFYPDTTDRYTVRENRSATTTGVKVDYTVPLRPTITIGSGLDGSLVAGREDFGTQDSVGQTGPSVHTPIHGGDLGVYAQSVMDPSVHWELRAGLRLDHHIAPLAGNIHQLSPRIRLLFFPNRTTSVWLYYGRLFIPSNVEDFHVLASAAQSGAAGLPTVPERDHYFETGLVRRLGSGVVTKAVGYYRDDSPAVDDNTLPGTALTTSVNIARVHVAGIETGVEVHPPGGPVSGYLNAALSHASAHGPITGGFFPTAYPTGWFDQDHDQRLSIVASGDYTPRWGYISCTAIFGSGLTNGHPDAAVNETGLFDFNPLVKVAPSLILTASAGVRLVLGTTVLSPELFVDNALNHHYILKGAFTSGPSVGRPRSIQLRVSVGH